MVLIDFFLHAYAVALRIGSAAKSLCTLTKANKKLACAS